MSQDAAGRRPTGPRRAARAVLLDDSGRVLLVGTKDHRLADARWWELPGGGIEAGETPADTAARELREETGYLDVALGPQVGSLRHTYQFAERRVDQVDHVFVAFLTSPRQQPQELQGHEIAEPRWFTRDELGALEAGGGTAIVPGNLGEVLDWLLDPGQLPRPVLRGPTWWPVAPDGTPTPTS